MSMYDRDWYRERKPVQRAVQHEKNKRRRSISAMTIWSVLIMILSASVTIAIIR